jgi:hypothetical protein
MLIVDNFYGRYTYVTVTYVKMIFRVGIYEQVNFPSVFNMNTLKSYD